MASLVEVDLAPLRKHCEGRLIRMDAKRAPWLDFCRLVGEELLPNRLPYLIDPSSGDRAGEQNTHIVDAVGHLSLGTAASGVVQGTMPSTSVWYGVVVRGDPETDDEDRRYLEDGVRETLDMHNAGNAHHVLPMCQEEWIAFGTAAALMLSDDEDDYRLDGLTVGEYWIADDHRGRCDTLYRRLTMTVGQLAGEFGVDALSERSRQAYENGHFDVDVECVHAIEPDRDDLNPLGDPELMPWRSVYYERDATNSEVLDVRGFRRFPALVWRAGKLPGSPYGYGRGHDVLPHLVRLRRLIYRYGETLAYKLKPPVQVPAGTQAHELSMVPGGRTQVLGQQPISTLWKVDQELREIAEQIEVTRQDVRDTLGATLVASLRRLTQTMTKREAELRTSQDLNEWLPGLIAMQDELQSPYVEWLWDIALERGRLRPRPPSLDNKIVDIAFVSPLARRQREGEVDAIVETFGIAYQIAEGGRPDILDNLNADAAIRLIAEIKGCPTSALEDIDEVKRVRQSRLRTQQAQATAAAAQQGVDIARGVAETRAIGAA